MYKKMKSSVILIALVPLLILCSVNIAAAGYYADAGVYAAYSNDSHSLAIFFGDTGLYMESYDYDGTQYYAYARDYMADAVDWAYLAWYNAWFGDYWYAGTNASSYAYQDYLYKVACLNNLNSLLQGNEFAGVEAILNSYMADNMNGWAAGFIGLSTPK